MSVRKGRQATMQAQFWKALRKALYEDMQEAGHTPAIFPELRG